MTPPRARPPKGSKADRMLDLWFDGWITPVIGRALGWKPETVRRLLREYRRVGEPRAVKRKTGRIRKGECRHPPMS